jgi:hypothetical protein
MISNADLVHDLADVLHETRMRNLIDGALPIESPSPLPTRRDREQAVEIVERLIELGVVGRARPAASDDSSSPELVAG